jgi:hypothetical protein
VTEVCVRCHEDSSFSLGEVFRSGHP